VPQGLAAGRTVRVTQLGWVGHSVTVEPVGRPRPRSRSCIQRRTESADEHRAIIGCRRDSPWRLATGRLL
jgi:hypothetical protein